ncbi:MAG: hypothetical protein K8T89_17880 [Planctomycetes bacterium]|nr:hypothetical protein [Planctomycetota bacterium]
METLSKTQQEEAIRQLEGRVAAIEKASVESRPFTTELTTLATHDLVLKKVIPVLVRPKGDDFVVSFVEANIGASGETLPQAIDDLKGQIAVVFKRLSSLSPDKLGRSPTRQLGVLSEFIQKSYP